MCAAYQEVEDLLRTSLPAMQAVHGPNALCVAGLLSLLTLVHAQVGNQINNVEADPVALALRALRIRRKLFGPSTALSQHEMLTAFLLAHFRQHKRAEALFRKCYVMATSSRKTPHRLRWLLWKYMDRSGTLGYLDNWAGRPKQPPWAPDYQDLTYDELEDFYLPEKEVHEIFSVLDKNGDGEISQAEFLKGLKAHPLLAAKLGMPFDICLDDADRNSYQLAFGKMDNDGSKSISMSELLRFCGHRNIVEPAEGQHLSPQSLPRSLRSRGGVSIYQQATDPVSTSQDIVDMVINAINSIPEETDTRPQTAAQDSARSRREDIDVHSSSSRSRMSERHEGTNPEESDRLVLQDGHVGLDSARVPLSRGTSARSVLSRSGASMQSHSRASSLAGSSIGTEQAREELDMLNITVVDMVSGVYDDVMSGHLSSSLPSSPHPATESEMGSRTPKRNDVGSRKLLRPLSAPGARHKLTGGSALSGSSLSAETRPHSSGPVRPSATSALQAIIRNPDEDDGLEVSVSDPRPSAVPRISMTAIGRSRRRMDSIDAKDEAGNTALHAAARDKDVDAVKSLLEAGANPSTANKSGEAPIHLAAMAGNLSIVKMIAADVTNINQQGPGGRTALHFAVQSASLSVVQTLCETYGADISSQSNDGETPVQLAQRVLGPDSSVSRYLTATFNSLPAI